MSRSSLKISSPVTEKDWTWLRPNFKLKWFETTLKMFNIILHSKMHHSGNNLEILMFSRKEGYQQCKSSHI